MELEALPLMRELGLTNQDIVFLGEVRVRQEDELGRGSDALVYRLNWQGIDIALKVLHPILIEPGVLDRERKIRSFGQEVFRLSRIHHPNLCQLLGIARVGRNAALALELLTSTLEELSIGEGREDGLKLIGYLCDTSAGIRYLHVRGIIHRDLAPKNVMIKNGVAKVCDFGVAKFVRLASPRQQQHQVQAARMDMTRCPGTLVFMPPEAMVEEPDYDRPLDIFSLGVTLLAVITGVMPGIDLINAPSIVIVRDTASGRETTQVVAETRRRAAYLRRLADDHPLKPLAVRCHSNEPSERPTAEEVHEEMKRVLQLFTSLSSPHPSNVPPAVVRRLDSISEQLAEQATSITALSARSDTLEEQLTAAITNNQTTTPQQLMETQQQLATAITNNQATTHQQLTIITNNQTATQQQLTATQQQLTATQQEVSTLRNEQTTTRHQVQALTDRLNGTNDRLDHQTTTLTDQLSDTNQRLHQQTTTLTQTSLQISSLRDQVSCVSDQLSRLSASTHQVSAPRPATVPGGRSGSATASATTARLQVSAPSPATVPGGRSGSATASATTARAKATAAASTTESAVGRGYHLLPAMPTPTQLANIKKRREWQKLEVRQHGKHALVATYSDKLVAVWSDGVDVTKIMETTDLQTWRSIDLPREYSKLAVPSLASHGGMLYMHCTTLPKSTTRGVRSILQYCDTPDNGDGSRGGGGRRRQWAKVTDVPSHCSHTWCTLHACDDAISLYGGKHRGTKHKHVSTYSKCSLASKQWSSSSSSNTSLVLPSLPLPCYSASLVTFPDSLYLVGGDTGCFFQHHDGRWVSTSPPDGVELKFSAACALSEHSMVICPRTPAAECVVHDILSGQSYPLPAIPAVSRCTPSLILFGSTLVRSVAGFGSCPAALYTLDMSV
ncbi:probable serine/threonine-protein kinase DDB_G0278901 isoform X2 [Sycon ciliatum]|uniref:probable serine/threonine-protein kinase DDB_G0278901 isoform X2 n=1 Tax=Sycon ciliatum TaxID=27933 RepID=UPI0031F701CE